jgi:hypothetical protein
MPWNPFDVNARNERYKKLQEESRLEREAEEKRKAILAKFPKPPLAPKDAPSGEVSKGIAAPGATRRNVVPLTGYGRKRKIGKTRRNRRLKKK